MNIDFSLIGQRIKQKRKAIKITQEKLAEELSVTVGYVSQIEGGRVKVNLEMLGKIATIITPIKTAAPIINIKKRKKSTSNPPT